MTIKDERSLNLIDYIGTYSGCPVQGDLDSLSHLEHYIHFTSLISNYSSNTNNSFEGRRVLDIGSGEGFGSYYFYLKGANVFGLDLAPEVVGYSNKKYGTKNLEFILGDATELPFEDESFDYVAGMDLIEHVEDVDKLCSEVKRVLKPGGFAYMLTPNYLINLVRRGCMYPFHVQEFSIKTFTELINYHFPESFYFTEDSSYLMSVGETFRSNDYKNISIGNFVKLKFKSIFKMIVPDSILKERLKYLYKKKYKNVFNYKFSLEDLGSEKLFLSNYTSGLNETGLNYIFLFNKK